jgi:hypothetical protein
MKKSTKLAVIPGGWSGIVWINKANNHRLYLSLDADEAAWLLKIAQAFNLTIEQFLAQLWRDELPKPPYPHDQLEEHKRTPAQWAAFQITCSDEGIRRQVEAIARYVGKSAEKLCAEAVLSTIETFNEDLVYHPETLEVLCDRDEIRSLVCGTTLPEPPPIINGRYRRGVEYIDESGVAAHLPAGL